MKNHIVNTTPKEFWLNLEDEISAAFQKAHKFSENYEEPERISILGQNRHAFCEAGFRNSADKCGFKVTSAHTNPKGGIFTYIQKENLFILRSNIQNHCGTPRATKFRKQFSVLNKWLEPHQYDLLEKIPEPPSDKICGMIVTTSYKPRYGKLGIPAYIGFGIPNADLTDWKYLFSIQELLALYHDRKDIEPTLQIEEKDIQDKAIPRLKQKKEKKDSDG